MIVYPLSFVPTFAAASFWLPAIALVLLVAVAIRATSGRPVARTALAFAVAFLLPALHLRAFNPEESLVHDRYLYLPSVGFCLLVALAFAELAGRAPSRRRWIALAALALAAVYGLLTVAQNRTWRDDGRLAEHALLRQPRSPFLQNFLGRHRMRQGELVEAEHLLRAAAEAAPEVGNYHLDLAGLLATAGRREEAEAAFERALARGATSALTFLNLGVTYLAQGRLAEGEAALEEARARQPANARIHVLLGWIAEQRGRDAAAEAAYREAVRLEPAAGEPHLRLGLWLARQGRDAEAKTELEAAQKALPREPELLLGLAGLHLRGRRCAEAVAILETLVALLPEHDRAHASLGLAYECLGDFARAAAAFRRAVAVGPETASGRIARERLAALPPGS
jgi:Flp pilus assembly protein TadD